MDFERNYYNQHIVLSRLRLPCGEIRHIKFTLYKENQDNYLQFGICKIVNLENKEEAEIMEKLKDCETGIIKYCKHYISNQIYIYMESCWSKGSLHEYLNKRSTFPKEKSKLKESFLIKAFKALIKGLEYIHSCSYIHSDIAAKNIFVTKSKQFKIGDFGGTVKTGDYMKLYSQHYVPLRYCKKF